MKRYDKYKPSGIDWIGEVPEHWEMTRLKHLCEIYGRIGYRGYTEADLVTESEGAITLSPSNFVNGRLDYTKCSYLSWEKYYESPEIMIDNGDVIFVKTASVGKCALVTDLPKEATLNPQIVVFKKMKCNGAFLNYLCQTPVIQCQVITSLNGSTIATISQEKIGSYIFALPPLAEQEAIAAYLDARCADIDKVVATQEKRIALLQELKQSEITQAVTRGLNPDAMMKDSGVEWIGMVPEHWEVIPFKSKFKTDKGLSITKADLVDEGVPVISYGQIHSKQNDYVHTLDHLLRFIPEEMAPADSKAKLEIGDIVFADTSEDVEGSGNAFYIDREGIYAGYHTVIAKSIERVDNKYFAYLFATPVWRSQVRSQVYGVKVFSITQQILKSTSLIAPPVEERKQIVEVLEEKCVRIDKQIEKIQNQIELLREYKQALITEVVTGKRRV